MDGMHDGSFDVDTLGSILGIDDGSILGILLGS